jgi:hypothetical protein
MKATNLVAPETKLTTKNSSLSTNSPAHVPSSAILLPPGKADTATTSNKNMHTFMQLASQRISVPSLLPSPLTASRTDSRAVRLPWAVSSQPTRTLLFDKALCTLLSDGLGPSSLSSFLLGPSRRERKAPLSLAHILVLGVDSRIDRICLSASHAAATILIHPIRTGPGQLLFSNIHMLVG